MSEISLHVTHGIMSKDIRKVILELLTKDPKIVWAEPTPRRERIPEFSGLWWKEDQDRDGNLAITKLETFLSKEDIRFDEAKLFWPEGWAHLLASGSKTKWAHFSESQPAPGFASVLENNEPEDSSKDRTTENPQAWTDLDIQKSKVLLQRDLNRYGLSGDLDFGEEPMHVTSWYQGTQLVVWKFDC